MFHVKNFLQHYEEFIFELLQDGFGESKFSSKDLQKGIKEGLFHAERGGEKPVETMDS